MSALAVVGAPAAKRRYTLPESFFMTSIRDAIRDSLFSPITLGERHDVKLKPKFETACWSYLPPHCIYVGTELFEKKSVKLGLSSVQQAKYIANHYHHELGHALFTDRDMAKLQKALRVIKCPFPLYNLFEDAYMEQRYRDEADYRFEWLDLELLDFSARPESLLFALIQAEGDISVVLEGLATWVPAPPNMEGGPDALITELSSISPTMARSDLEALMPRVAEYYRRIIAVKESMHLMPLLKAWIDEFGLPPSNGSGGSGFGTGGASDLEIGAKLQEDPNALADFEKDVVGVTGATPDDELTEGKPGKVVSMDSSSLVSSKGRVLHRTATAVNLSRAGKLADRFKKFFAEKTRVVGSHTPQRRISARHFALDRAPYRKKEIEGRGVKKVFLEIDCSGSMGGFHIMEGKVLITALSMLAKQGHVTGYVALSAVNDRPNWELYKLPMGQSEIDRIQGYAGAEGLEYTMRDNLKVIQECDYVFVYTDAQICDRPIDKSFFHRYGVYTWGLYAGAEGTFLDELMKYFDKALMRDNAEALVDAMLIQNK